MPKKQPVILLLSQQTMWWRAMLSGVANYSHLRGHWSFFNHPITLYSGRWAFAQTAYRKTKVLPLIERVKPDAMIISDSVTDYEEAAALGLPLIAYRSVGKDIPGIPMIVTDNEAGGKVAAEHLPERGFQDFAFCGYDDCYWSTDRCKGFNNAIAQAGHSNIVYQHLKPQSRSWETEQPYLIEWLKSLPKPIGLMACNDERGLDITTACMAAGISVPEEIAVVGMDNDELVCILSTPPLSTVHRNAERAGFAAAETLDRMMRRKKPDKLTILVQPDHVIARQSTDILAVQDPEVAKAVRFIRERAGRNLRASDVVQVTLLSRTALYERFHKALGHSIRAEINRIRMNRIYELLRETDLTISEIAYELDFLDIHNLWRYFRKHADMTPLQYRKTHARR